MKSSEIREKYLKFFESKNHKRIPSSSLIPGETDPSVLFTTAGMHPLVLYLLGEKHPAGTRLTDSQKCIRTGDIDEVGDASHLTFFEMLGNWSLGDYFKKEAIEWSWEFLTSPEWLGLDKNRLAVSVFAGDADAPFDQEAFDIWKNLGVSEERIARLPKKQNWWGPAGQTGPCGPDTEIFYWVGDLDKIPDSFNDDNDSWIEIWNNVFMQYNKNEKGEFEPLQQQNVDTGMGLERITMVMEGKNNVYETDLFTPLIEELEKISGVKYIDREKSFRIIVDHIKAATFVISDGVTPSNTNQGYVVRKLIRRAIRHGKHLAINKDFIEDISKVVINIYQSVYPELKKNEGKILLELKKEEEKFRKTLNKGIQELAKEIFGIKVFDTETTTGNSGFDPEVSIDEMNKKITGKYLFYNYSTNGFPLEMSLEEIQGILRRKGVELENAVNLEKIKNDFEEEFKKHQELSRTASAGMFKGGLADAGEVTVKYHTATHLLLAAIRNILGPEIYQKGSNINAERLRFDFNYPQKLTEEQIQKIENLINEKIQEDIAVEMTEMSKTEALSNVKVSFDPAKYGDVVKVYKIGDFSIELCGGPHVKSTGELGKFKIQKEESSGAGVRRIKAILE